MSRGVPAIQKQIISACHHARVPVITATQMLNSMETTSRPTRAEANDVFNAVLDGTDAVMLSGETAIGHYPVESVTMMSRIVGEAECDLFSKLRAGVPCTWSISNGYLGDVPGANRAIARAGVVKPITESVVEAASHISRRLNAALLVVATYSGRTALALSKQRNPAPTLALAHDAETARAMSLFWGVTALPMPQLAEENQLRVLRPPMVQSAWLDRARRLYRRHPGRSARISRPQRNRGSRGSLSLALAMSS